MVFVRPVPASATVLVILGVILSGCVAPSGSKASVAGPATVPPDADKGQILVTVLDESEIPIAEAQVALIDTDPRKEAITDEGGTAVFNNLEPAN